MIAPCKNCNDRKVGCHSVCDRYIQFKEYMDDIHKKQDVERALRAVFRERSYDRYIKAKKHTLPRKKADY